MVNSIKISDEVKIGNTALPVIIAGPCVIENEETCLNIAEFLRETCEKFNLNYIFKASFDKANRSSISSYRGPDIDKGLDILKKVKDSLHVPVLTDIHEPWQTGSVAEIVDIIQIPAFLCRQTNLLVAAGKTGLPINIKKGQFMAPEDMKGAVEKVYSTGNKNVMLTERGTSFGYHNLVVDMRSLVIMRNIGTPVVFDATHSVQLPGGLGNASGGQREFVLPLARAAVAVGIDALFMEVHPEPDKALSDGPNSLDFATAETLLIQIVSLLKR